ncbi:MAG: hypothetical protein ISS79_07655 [Phycisphaerae bacterium]|nr:hypothetical protein [Phycisphaerae bacterium]
MSKVPMHFIGFLSNVDDSISAFDLGEGTSIEKWSQNDTLPFLKKIEFHWGTRDTPLVFDSNGAPSGCYCVVKRNAAEFEATPQGGGVIRFDIPEQIHRGVQDKLRLLRLFKEGNVVLGYSFLYHDQGEGRGPRICNQLREYPIADGTIFKLAPEEVPAAQSFITSTSLPFSYPFLQLAFDSFERSYELHHNELSFLSLMIAMEILFKPKDARQELTYRVSRNTAVLLGKSIDEGDRIFKEIKSLYSKRSKLVHTGDNTIISQADVLNLRRYVRESIKEILRTQMDKKTLLELLNSCGFGQRPWEKTK